MVKGLYTAYTGMIHQQKRLDTLTNNLANAATTGYKKEGATAAAFKEAMSYKIKDGSEAYLDRQLGGISLGVKVGESYRDFSQGAFKITNANFDLALEGNGFFSISFTNKQGEQSVKYTRDGSFTMSEDGYLMTKDGDFVLDVNQNPIRLDTTENFSVDILGNIYQGEQVVNTLGIVDFEDYNYLEAYGENLFDLVEGGEIIDSGARVYQGYLETSNVQTVSEMVEMITVTRAYETNQKIINSIDSTLDKVVNQVGKV